MNTVRRDSWEPPFRDLVRSVTRSRIRSMAWFSGHGGLDVTRNSIAAYVLFVV